MSYVHKNTTLVLFFLLILSIVAFSGNIIYYQQSLTRLNDVITVKNTQIKGLSTQITSLRTNLSNLNEILNIQLKREENLSEQFINLKLEKEEITGEKQNLEEMVNLTQDELFEAKLEIELLELNITKLSQELNETKKDLENVLDDVEDICNAAVSLNISDCEDYT
jgi:chromosome segregation ATPase